MKPVDKPAASARRIADGQSAGRSATEKSEMTTRSIRRMSESKPTTEGAGVRLHRAFGYHDAPQFDPFLLLDDFRSDVPEDYAAGFPWHPHRGIETITYVLRGDVEHMDSLGNRGTISSGDIQWMTAGSGIVHREMPKGDGRGRMHGFQLWANLPHRRKMMDPRYRDVKRADTPEAVLENGVRIRIVCGRVAGLEGPVRDIVTDPEYLDVTVPPRTEFVHPTKRGHTALAYTIDGSGRFGAQDGDEKPGIPPAGNRSLVLFNDGDRMAVSAGAEGIRFLFFSGIPLGEPVAWFGPIAMNTDDELRTAFEEYRNGTFIKRGSGSPRL